MIEQSQQVLLEAIKASLFGNAFSYPADTDWDAVMKEARSQTVMGLISSVIPVHDESSDQGKAYYMRLLYEQDKLLKLLDHHNIPCVILKGCAAAVYYPRPYLRAMGDVDFLVPRDRFDEAKKLMESNGYIRIEGKDEDDQQGQEVRHLGYCKNGIEFELHHHFSSRGFNIDDMLEKAIDQRVYRELNGYRFPMLPDTENGLVLLGHIHQHLTFDHLGLRQIIDWEMYDHSVLNSGPCGGDFARIAQEIGLLELAVNVTFMCEKYLGLSISDRSVGLQEAIKRNDPDKDEIADQLLTDLLTYGNFGRKQLPSSECAGESIRSVTAIIENKGLYSYFRDNGLNHWGLCKKHPVLKPFAFIYGMFRFFVRGIARMMKTGSLEEQITYIKEKNQYDRSLGIRTKGIRK